jgi:hypothetical protein
VPSLSEEEIKKLADDVWDTIKSAYGWGDGFTDAYNTLLTTLRKVNG